MKNSAHSWQRRKRVIFIRIPLYCHCIIMLLLLSTPQSSTNITTCIYSCWKRGMSWPPQRKWIFGGASQSTWCWMKRMTPLTGSLGRLCGPHLSGLWSSPTSVQDFRTDWKGTQSIWHTTKGSVLSHPQRAWHWPNMTEMHQRDISWSIKPSSQPACQKLSTVTRAPCLALTQETTGCCCCCCCFCYLTVFFKKALPFSPCSWQMCFSSVVFSIWYIWYVDGYRKHVIC